MSQGSVARAKFITFTLLALLLLTGCQSNGLIEPTQLHATAQSGEHSQSYTYTLDNGLKVILWPNSNSHSQNEASLNLVVFSGSLHEEDNQLGYAHFVEHMLFNQRDSNGNNPILEGLADLNIEMATHANAYTTFDHTNYYLDIPNTSDSKITEALSLLANFAYKSTFIPEEVNKEIGVVREEWRRSDPEKQSYDYQRQQLDLANSRYIHRPPIGTLTSIEAATPAKLQPFYQQHYRADNAALVIAGNFDVASIAQAINSHFANWQGSQQGRTKTYAKPPMRIATFDHIKDLHAPDVHIWIGDTYALPNGNNTGKEREYQYLITDLMMQLIQNRLDKIAITQNNSLRDFDAAYYQNQGNHIDVGLGIRSSLQDMETTTKLLGAIYQDLQQNGFNQIELDNIRAQTLKNEQVQQYGSQHLSLVAISHLLDDNWLRDQAHYLAMLENRLPKLTVEGLNQHFQQLFAHDLKIEITSKPKVTVPSENQIRTWLQAKDSSGLTLVAEPISANKAINWQVKLPAGQIRSHQTLDNGIHLLTLSNGITVRYQYSDSTPNKFYMSMQTLGGYNALSNAEIISARLGLVIMGASGLQELSGPELKDWLEGQALTLHPEYNFDTRGLRIDGPTAQAETLFKLAHVALQDAKVDPAIYQHYQSLFEQEIKDLQKLAYADYIEEVENYLAAGNPSLRSLSLAEVQSITTDSMVAVYEKYMAGSQNYVLNIAGDINIETLLPLLENNIASLPVNNQTPANIISMPRWQGNDNIQGKGSNEKATSLSYYLQADNDQLNDPNVASLHLLSALIRKHLDSIVREDLGLTYSIQADFYHLNPVDKVKTLGIHLQCDPTKTEQITDLIEQSLADLAITGFTQASIDQQLDIYRGDFSANSHKAKNILWRLLQAQIFNTGLASLHEPEIVIPEVKANVINDTLSGLVNHRHSRLVTSLNP